MKKIAIKLIEFGQSFQYEHNGSDGEILESFELDVKIYNQEGKLTLMYEGELDEVDENERGYDYMCLKLHEIIVEATT